MPQPGLPLTPAPSLDLSGKENATFSKDDALFSLPPSATEAKSEEYLKSSRNNSLNKPDHDNPPTPKSEAAQEKHAPSSAANDVSLPPPPTRSRKIIQMKPKTRQTGRGKQAAHGPDATYVDKPSVEDAAPSGGKKKGGNSGGSKTSKKVARKTAHSLIERRRRSKMNEEFATLKNMIPACAGQDMHKLAILQAGIDYVRYLEQCVTDLKAGANQQSTADASRLKDGEVNSPSESADYDDESDEEMEDVNAPQETYPQELHRNPSSSSLSGSTAVASPPFSVDTQSGRKYSQISTKELISPALSAQYAMSPRIQGSRQSWSSYTGSAQTSPMVLPQEMDLERSKALDHEASAALLLLNSTDRRGSTSTKMEPSKLDSNRAVRGMSVKDLLRN